MNEDKNPFEDKLACIATIMGEHMGDMVKCIVQIEMETQMRKINQLKLLLEGGCEPPNMTH